MKNYKIFIVLYSFKRFASKGVFREIMLFIYETVSYNKEMKEN